VAIEDGWNIGGRSLIVKLEGGMFGLRWWPDVGLGGSEVSLRLNEAAERAAAYVTRTNGGRWR